MLSITDEGIQNTINAVSKVICGEREREAPKRRSPFQNRDAHNGEAIGNARLEEALMRASDTGKSADRAVLHSPCRIRIGLNHVELARRYAEFKAGHMPYLIST
ncbi:hypothetical protein [uncultured Roseobacter sp.]|uniref:hypothetical protein n=1 Tax=uncultured Roseobacter sp. TaxID=114847 RepID=UPI0026318ECB|nr:hypothetical protein [uncultured Roseobacter sp.]